jgi:nitrogen regulatory protein PII
MKEIKAYIKRHKLDEVTWALHKIEGLTGMSILAVQGYGQGWHQQGSEPGSYANQRPSVKLEIYCRDELVNEVVATIEKAAHTGLKGYGKIYVADIEQAVRISNGERGLEAI